MEVAHPVGISILVDFLEVEVALHFNHFSIQLIASLPDFQDVFLRFAVHLIEFTLSIRQNSLHVFLKLQTW